MFALSLHACELVAASHAWSLFAVEAALKLRFDMPEKNGSEAHPAGEGSGHR
jgi:hypothetical protein